MSYSFIAPHDSAVLRDRIRSLIETELGRELDAAYLYGSRARGDARPDSDWDVLVMLHDDADWTKARAKMRRLTGQLAEEANERVSILPLRWSDANEHAGLLTNVAREGQRL
ncbi:MAG: nucleotidyltransferase domain-containing protein [Sandaracinobacter sp.]